MKELTLVRHAKSSWKYPELDDFDRPLNNRGRHDLPAMTKRIAAYPLRPDLILSSSAKRALTTATAIHTCLQLPVEQLQTQPELYEACSETLMLILQNLPESTQHVMLVGHNPGLESLAYLLTHEPLEKFPTAAVLHLQLGITEWHELAEDCASIILFDYPKKHLNTPA